MNKALLGALALGVGSNALFGQKQQPGQMQGKTPGFFGDVKDAAMKELPGALVRGGLGAIGFEEGGKVGGGLWDGLQEVIPFLKSVENARGVLAANAANNQAALGAPTVAKAQGLTPEQQAVVEQTKQANQELLMPTLPKGYGALYKSTGGTALARKKNTDWRPDGFTGATKKHPSMRGSKDKVRYKKTGGALASPMGDNSFMMEHEANFKEKVGPLAKTMYKSAGGETYERSYHNPLAAKPDGGKAKEE